MELIEINQAIEDAKASYELAKSEKEANYYKWFNSLCFSDTLDIE